MGRIGRIAVPAALAIVLGAVPGLAGTKELGTVRLGWGPWISDAPFFVAMAKGFFEAEGVKVETESFASSAKMMQPLSLGQLHVSSGGVSAGLFNAIASGADIRAVADKGQGRPGTEFVHLVMRKDLVEGGRFKGPKDLRGLRLSVNAPGLIQEYILAKYAESGGVPWKDLNVIAIAPPNFNVALRNKALDGGIQAEPYGAYAESEGLGVRVFAADKVKALERVQISLVVLSGRFVKENPALAKAFMRAYVKGIQEFNQRTVKDPEVVSIISRYSKIPEAAVRNAVPAHLDNEGRLDVESLAAVQDWFVSVGSVKERIPMEKVVDMSLLK
jgi:NitT/TauT family transport system substrate-binding protein